MSLRSVGEGVELLLRDILGFLIPGAVLLVALHLTLGAVPDQAVGDAVSLPPQKASDWLVLTVGAYVLGYVLQGVGEGLIVRLVNVSQPVRCCYGWLLPNVEPYTELADCITSGRTFAAARRNLGLHVGVDLSSESFREVRNVAMSVAPNRTAEVYRNMYASQLCLGAATALLLATAVSGVTNAVGLMSTVEIDVRAKDLVWLAGFLPASAYLVDRRYRYYSISMRIPFHIALAETSTDRANKKDEQEEAAE